MMRVEGRIERYYRGGLSDGRGTFFGVQVRQEGAGRSELLLRVFFDDGSHLALRGAIRGGSFLLSGEGGCLRGQAGETFHGELVAGSIRATLRGDALPPYADRRLSFQQRATLPSPERSAAHS